MKQPTLYLLSCGDELLFGHTVDTNSAWLAEQATLLGWRVVGHRTAGDVTPDIIEMLLEATDKADFVIMTGGLGPTEDDRTRQALAQAMGVELFEDAEALEEIRARFKMFNRPMIDANKVQALLPVGARRIVNPNGTAPGIQADLRGARVFCVPGVPREMREMFKDSIRPLMQNAPGAECEVMRRLHLCGVGESEIGAAIKHLMGERSNPEVGTAVAEGVITVRLYAKGASTAEAQNTALEAEKQIREALSQDIYGVDGETLAGCVARLLREKGAKLIVAESCTGGMASSMIVDEPGVSDVFLEGIVAYHNSAKITHLGVDAELLDKYGAVSREVATAMAETPLRKGRHMNRGPIYSLATTGIAGPDGGTPDKPVGTVWIACSYLDANGTGLTRTMRYNTLTDRHGVRVRAANAALDLLRRTIRILPSNYKVEARNW